MSECHPGEAIDVGGEMDAGYGVSPPCSPTVVTAQEVLQLGLEAAQRRCAAQPTYTRRPGVWLGNCLLSPASLPSDSYFALWQIRKLIEFLNTDVRPMLAVEQLAQVVGHSRSHFTRIFKHSFGVSPAMFLMYRRLEKVRWTMRNSHLRLTDIALEFGFCDQSHFCRSFKRQTGISPRAWRYGQPQHPREDQRCS